MYRVLEDPSETEDLSSLYPAVVARLKAELIAFPHGEPIDDPAWKFILDPDRFGGEIDREPYAGREGSVLGPLYPGFYVLGLLMLMGLGLLVW
ncbi:MAG: hypothetical protein AAFP02_12770, partial [Bacteroidota bacterium]